ncbi:hypothetical protein NJC38_14810 [Pseudomonas sp. 21LCFQ010]|uniref:hypothetical protein n=1 Tax=Pseudomonas sp. 21LCFQ010 TaxID=2957506 RepID=UPI0020977F67|nr:hypothetical protein [Pseudomonas sp. 21LCFQ010]MCO8163430.1 hypothetical protein [Pseudomonas sp. 21LCFQ010]
MRTALRLRQLTVSLLGISLLSAALLAQAAPARYYKWQGADRVICAQTSPGWGWTRLNGSYVKSDCSI